MTHTLFALAILALSAGAVGAFDGSKWNVSTGNLSVSFIQGSPIGAFPKPGYNLEPPPSVEALVEMKRRGLVAYEDYVAWGAVEREPGKWDWTQHDKVCEAIEKAGLHYVVYNWVHFPPAWLRDSKDATLMRCLEHRRNANYLSIFDPGTIEHYDRFYRALAEHFGDRIDGVYACILGPYGEGNYPLMVPDWVNMGHCHEGYWCADPYAISAYRDAMRRQYGDIAPLNKAWATSFRSFAEVRPPQVIKEGFKPSPEFLKTAAERRQWLDFIRWYHQAIIDFAEKSIRVTLKYFPQEKVRTKPGGNAGGVNPIAWGTYCPGYARMAGAYGIVLQPADCHGAVFGDKWVGTAYAFYGVPLSTEPAGGLDGRAFVRRIFSDASCGASQLFTYEFDSHAADTQDYVHLFTGRPGDTEIALLCPTTLYRLGGDLGPTIRAADQLRDLTDFDVLDELLIEDGILTKRIPRAARNDVNKKRYRVLIILQADFVEQSILHRIEAWVRAGGTLVVAAAKPVRSVEGDLWSAAAQTRRTGRGTVNVIPVEHQDRPPLQAIRDALQPFIETDGTFDGVWTTRRGSQVFMLNTTDKPAVCEVLVRGRKVRAEIPAHRIWDSR